MASILPWLVGTGPPQETPLAAAPPLLLPALGKAFPAGTLCIGLPGLNQKSTGWCYDTCLVPKLSKALRTQCEASCDCHTWNRLYVNTVLGSFGAVSLVSCCLVLLLDCCGGPRACRRPPCQTKSLFWSNVCNFFYSIYYLVWTIADTKHPIREPAGRGVCERAWLGFLGYAACQQLPGRSPACFLNCCVFAVPWLEFFGYASLLWNITWLLDLVRFAYRPLGPEKVCGVPLMLLYHLFTWPATCFVAFFNRVTTMQCRSMPSVMLPCILRKGSILEHLPVVHIGGLAIALAAATIMARRYFAVSSGLGASEARPAASRVRMAVRKYVQQQCRHVALLVTCWVVILLDNTFHCEESGFSYFRASCFAGLGFFLSIDRILLEIYPAWTPRCPSFVRWSWFFQRNELALSIHHGAPRTPHPPQEPTEAAPPQLPIAIGPPSAVLLRTMSSPTRLRSEATIQLVDFEVLLAHVAEYFHQERTAEAELEEVFGSIVAEERLLWLARVARLDDHPCLDSDCRLSSRAGTYDKSSEFTEFTVAAPRTFAYLRCLWGVELERLSAELSRTSGSLEAGSLKTAAKSGSVLLPSRDGRSFLLKTVPEEEARELRVLLPAYRRHMEAHPSSNLCRIYGTFTLTTHLGSRLHAVLMAYLSAPPDAVLACCGASGSIPKPTMMIDIKSEFQDGRFCRSFPAGFVPTAAGDGGTNPSSREEVCSSLAADYAFLAEVGVVDYSLLIALWELPGEEEEEGEEELEECPLAAGRGAPSAEEVGQQGGARSSQDEAEEERHRRGARRPQHEELKGLEEEAAAAQSAGSLPWDASDPFSFSRHHEETTPAWLASTSRSMPAACSGADASMLASTASWPRLGHSGSTGCLLVTRGRVLSRGSAATDGTFNSTSDELSVSEVSTVICNGMFGRRFAMRLGIIDFLVPFGARKRTESALKRTLLHPIHHHSKVTIVDPQRYAERQLDFVQRRLFPPQPPTLRVTSSHHDFRCHASTPLTPPLASRRSASSGELQPRTRPAARTL